MSDAAIPEPVIPEAAPGAPVRLARKLCAIMAQLERLPKNGYNEFHQYHYVLEADVTDALRKRLAEARVVMIPALEHVQRDGDITTVTMRFTLLDADSGETIVIPWQGQGQDKNDKGIPKAVTAATKYVLLKTFQLSAGDDPEADTRTARAAALRAKARRAAPAAAQPALPAGPFLVRITEGHMEQRTSKDGETLLFFRGQAAAVDTGETFPIAAWRANAQALDAGRKMNQPVLVQGGFQGDYPDFQVRQAQTPKPQPAPPAAAPGGPPAPAEAAAPPAPSSAPAAPAEVPDPEDLAALRKTLWARMKAAQMAPADLLALANARLGTSVTTLTQLSAPQLHALLDHLTPRAS